MRKRNKALQGIVAHSGAGFTTPIGDVQALAMRIEQLARHREELAQFSLRARRFAAEHCFEATYARRVAHLVECAGPRLAAQDRQAPAMPALPD